MKDEWLTTWGERLREQGRSERTVADYLQKLRRFRLWLSTQDPPDFQVDKGRLRLYLAHLRDERRLRPRSIRVIWTALASYFTWAEGAGLCTPPRVWTVPPPKLDEPQRDVPTEDELARLLAAVDRMPAHTEWHRYQRLRSGAVVTILVYTFLRRGELLALELGDVDRRTDDWSLIIRRGKGDKPRWVPLNTETQARLAAWLAFLEGLGDDAGWRRRHGVIHPGLWPFDKRRRMNRHGLREILTTLCASAGITRFTPHSLRHGGASVTFAAGADLETMRALLGHTSLHTTALYLHSEPGRMRGAVERAQLGRAAPPAASDGPQGMTPPRDRTTRPPQELRTPERERESSHLTRPRPRKRLKNRR